VSTRHGGPARHSEMSRLRTRYTQLVKICRGRGCSREDAKDLIQEAHWRLIVYQRSARVTDADYLLRRILVNLAINHYHRVLTAPFTYEAADKLDRRGLLIVPGAGPERTLAAEQEIDRVVSALSAVSPRTCQIFLAHRGGYSYEEIALAFAIRPRTVEKHIATASSSLLGI
jgi:RNA polymerase sigma factor (sigma-70 family)